MLSMRVLGVVVLCFLLARVGHSLVPSESGPQTTAFWRQGSTQDVDFSEYKTCFFRPPASFTIRNGKDERGEAWGFFEDHINRKGYGLLSITTNPTSSDEAQMLCAGYLEGALTAHRIAEFFYNAWYSTFNSTNSGNIVKFTQETLAWTRQMVAKQSRVSTYWRQVGLLMSQFDGLVKGYNAHAHPRDELHDWELFLLNMVGDLDDLIPALNRREKLMNGQAVEDLLLDPKDIADVLTRSHCSVLIKTSPDGSELLAAHTMWTGYWQMTNVYKSYAFSLKEASTVTGNLTFSSYPGLLSSEDDFYVLGSGLVVMETTNNVFNLSLYDAITPESLMSWIRVVVANRMTSSGSEWVKAMALYNSGTYNNQWMVLDYKKWSKGQTKLAPGTLWIGSQLPGYFKSADVSNVVNTQGYWPSYNIPYLTEIYDLAGYPAVFKKYGDLFSYQNCPRAKIFRARQGQVHDVGSLQRLIRYNNWQADPLSLHCPANQIAARFDLAPVNSSQPFCSANAFGATNAKVTSSEWVGSLQAVITGGPTHDQQPPFEWTEKVSKQFPHARHFGQPRKFDFGWLSVGPHSITDYE